MCDTLRRECYWPLISNDASDKVKIVLIAPELVETDIVIILR